MNEMLGNESAFPLIGKFGNESYKNSGLTVREYFAVLAMQSMELKDIGNYSINDIKEKRHLQHPKWVAEAAVNYADALIEELNKKGN